MSSNSSVKEFESRCAQKKANGLVDLKFCTVNSRELTPEEFCEQANAIDDAVSRGDFEEFNFGDSKRK